MKTTQNFAAFLIFLGSINYGIQAIFDINLFHRLFYNFPLLLKVIYFLIGVSAFISLLSSSENKKK